MSNKEISQPEALEMMHRCKDEIQALRAQLDALRPKAEAYDSIHAILRLLPQPSQSVGQDLVWLLDKRIREIAEVPTDA